jgi:hypothetical protein
MVSPPFFFIPTPAFCAATIKFTHLHFGFPDFDGYLMLRIQTKQKQSMAGWNVLKP